MAEVPPSVSASAAQAGYQVREATRDRDAARTGQAQAAERQVRAGDDAAVIVETSDGDTRVFADAEGGGSQGREENQTEAQSGEENTSARSGITHDPDGRPHVDLDA